MASFHLKIVSTNGKAFDGEVESIVLPGLDGEFGILAHHTPLIAAIRLGVAKVTKDGVESFFLVGNGFVDVANNEASVNVGNASQVKDRETGLKLSADPKPWEALEAMNNA